MTILSTPEANLIVGLFATFLSGQMGPFELSIGADDHQYRIQALVEKEHRYLLVELLKHKEVKSKECYESLEAFKNAYYL